MSRSKTPRCALTALTAPAILAPARAALQGDPAAPEPGWRHQELAGDVYYQVFVRSFADSDGDGVGDLLGLVERLDYLNDGDPATGARRPARARGRPPTSARCRLHPGGRCGPAVSALA
jgi:hypothetical protein